MEPKQFFATSRVAIVAGKGGVGKTAVTATLARAAARCGLTSLVVEVEGKSGLAAMFGEDRFAYDETVLATESDAEVRARTLTPDDALLEYLDEHGMKRLSKRLVGSGALDVVATAVPGIRDILVLGKVKQIELAMAGGAADAPDLVILDAPAAGHAIGFLRSARGLVDAVNVGPINAQAQAVLELLTDADRCQVVLVTLPEETPVNELIETAFSLEDEVGVKLGPVVVNGLYPALGGLDAEPGEAAAAAGTGLREGEASELSAAAAFRRHRRALQTAQVQRLAEALPLPQIPLGYRFEADLDPAEIDALTDELLEGVAALADADPPSPDGTDGAGHGSGGPGGSEGATEAPGAVR